MEHTVQPEAPLRLSVEYLIHGVINGGHRAGSMRCSRADGEVVEIFVVRDPVIRESIRKFLEGTVKDAT